MKRCGSYYGFKDLGKEIASYVNANLIRENKRLKTALECIRNEITSFLCDSCFSISEKEMICENCGKTECFKCTTSCEVGSCTNWICKQCIPYSDCVDCGLVCCNDCDQGEICKECLKIKV